MKIQTLAATLFVTAILSGCLVPEKFAAKVDVQPDASYTFSYAGTMVNAFAALEMTKAGKLSANSDEQLKKEVASISKEPDVRSVSYKGNGRYELALESKKKPGQPFHAFSILNVSTDKDGVMTISSPELKDKDKKELDKLGMKIDGTLDVTIPKNAEVLSHNATSTPTFFGLFGTYTWKIGRVDQRPVMKLRFKK